MTNSARILGIGCILAGLLAHGCTCSRHASNPPAEEPSEPPPPAEINPPAPEEMQPENVDGQPADSDSDSDWGDDSNQDKD